MNEMTRYDREALTAMYKALEFMECNNLPTFDLEEAIKYIEARYK